MQQRRFSLVVLLSILAGASTLSAGTPIHIFILAGQSNALSHEVGAASLPNALKPEVPDVLFWFEEGGNSRIPRIDSGNDFVPLDSQSDPSRTTFGVAEGYGSEITAGRNLLSDIGGKIAFIKFAFGATGIEQHWDPDEGSSLFWELIDLTDDALAELSSRGYDGEFSGFFWVQGEYDAKRGAHAPLYETRLDHFVDQLRTHLGAPSMKFVIARLHDDMDLDHLNTVRAAQEDVAASDSRNFLVNADDLALQSDDLHYKGKGQRGLGSRFADLATPGASSPGLETAPLINGKMVWGQYQSGGLSSVLNIDSNDVVVDSTLSGGDWRAGVQATADSPHATVDQLRVTIRAEISEDPVTAGVMALNHSSGQYDILSFFDFDLSDAATLTLDVSNPNNYVAGNGNVTVRVLSLSESANVPAGHTLRVDQIKIQVRDAS